MKAVTILALLVAVAFTAKPNYQEMFQKFKIDYKRTYATKKEEAKRFRAFEQNMEIAAKHQSANPLATFGVNEYADMTPAEFKILHSAERHFAAQNRSGARMSPTFSSDTVASLTKIDWRAKGAVTAVKNQGYHCGSCWSFSTTGNIEGQWFLAGNKLTSASEQELVSCDTTDGGCHGGLPVNAFEWLISERKGQIVTEASYPYVSGNGQVPPCSVNSKMPVAATISSYVNIDPSEEQMAAWCNVNGPISIGVDGTSWQTYIGGVLTNCISQQLDHAVLVVGFDITYSTPYWIIKNSWGPTWGENGYIRVAYGSNQCLLSNAPASSTVGKGPRPVPPAPSIPTTIPPPGPSPTTVEPVLPSPTATEPIPPPPTTTPQSSGGYFTQYVCEDRSCSDGCQGNTLPLGECLRVAEGISAIAECTATAVILTRFQTSDCTGTSTRGSEPLDKCFRSPQGQYAYNDCQSSSHSQNIHNETAGILLQQTSP